MYSTSSTLAAHCLPRYWFAAVLASIFPSLPPAWEEELSLCLTTAGADAGANYRFAISSCANVQSAWSHLQDATPSCATKHPDDKSQLDAVHDLTLQSPGKYVIGHHRTCNMNETHNTFIAINFASATCMNRDSTSLEPLLCKGLAAQQPGLCCLRQHVARPVLGS